MQSVKITGGTQRPDRPGIAFGKKTHRSSLFTLLASNKITLNSINLQEGSGKSIAIS